MEIEILEEEANPMLHRTDVRFEVVHNEATPGRLSVRDSLAARLNKDAEEVVVHELDTKYGMRRTVGYAKVYDSPADAQDVEQEYMLTRNKIGDAAPDHDEEVDDGPDEEVEEVPDEEVEEVPDEEVEEAPDEEAEEASGDSDESDDEAVDAESETEAADSEDEAEPTEAEEA